MMLSGLTGRGGVMKLFLFLVVVLCLVGSASALQIVPDLYGFGTETRAAYGAANDPEICIVNSTAITGGSPSWNASGYSVGVYQGTLYQCIELNTLAGGNVDGHTISANSGKVILFETSGTINQTSSPYNYRVDFPYTTIAGQSAPSPGITLRNIQFQLTAHDTFVQHIRSRVGDAAVGYLPRDRRSIVIQSTPTSGDVYNVVVDHVTATWGIDTCFTFWENPGDELYNVTVSNSLIGEGLQDSLHPDGDHAKGLAMQTGITNASAINNFIVQNSDRNPYIRWGSKVVSNNLMYNNEVTHISVEAVSGSSDVAAVGNVILKGPTTYGWGNNGFIMFYNEANPDNWDASNIYLIDNDYNGTTQTDSTDWSEVYNKGSDDMSPYKVTGEDPASNAPLWPDGYTAMDSSLVQAYVLANAGARPIERDSVDTRLVETVDTYTGDLVDCVEAGTIYYPTGTAQGGTSTTIILAADLAIKDDRINGKTIEVISGPCSGQSRTITDWVKTTDTATVSSWTACTPTSSSVYRVLNVCTEGNAAGGYPVLDVNKEVLSIPANPHTVTGSGYTNLEVWLQELANEVEGDAESETDSLDNNIRSSDPNQVVNDTTNFGVGQIGPVNKYRSWIWFNLSEYNSTDTITTANLSLFWYYTQATRDKSTDVGIYLSNATTDSDYLTWNNSSDGVPWREPGGNWLDADGVDNGTTPFDSELFPDTAADDSFHVFNITELVQAIVNESRTNNGFFIIANETDTNYIAFSSLDNATEAHRPTLNITHSIAEEDPTADFTYYKIITLNQSMINQSIGTGKYPLLVSDIDTDLRDNCQADGDDIVFFDSDNTTLLPYEQEFWNSTTGELVEWVGIEDVTNVSHIVMYYNNSTIANSENITGVWDPYYKLVMHFQETDIDGGAGDIKDSTSNDNDGTTHNMTTANLDTGLIDGCFNFSKSNEARVNVSDDSTLDGFTSGMTVSGVFNFNQEGAYYLVNKYDAGGDQRAWLLKLEGNDNLRIYVDDAGTAAEISNFNPTIVPGTDYKIDAVWESGEYPILYVNGALANEVDHDGLVSTIKDSSAILRIGGGYSPGNTLFTGDEIRISNIARSHAYIETDYNNSAYPELFIDIGAEQEDAGAPYTKFEYWTGSAWVEDEAQYYLWFTCFWYTPECANAEQSGSQATLKILNNGTASGTPKMKLNESAPSGIRIFVDDDNTFADAVELTNTYQAVSTSLNQDTNVTLWAWANLSGAPAWEFETYAIVE